MSRSGYTDDSDDILQYGRWRAQVNNSIRGKRGQAFLKELLSLLDIMPAKELIADELITDSGKVCAIGLVCQSRGIDVSKVDYNDPHQVAGLVDISYQMAAEIEYINDESIFVQPVEVAGPPRGRNFRHPHMIPPIESALRWKNIRSWAKRHIQD